MAQRFDLPPAVIGALIGVGALVGLGGVLTNTGKTTTQEPVVTAPAKVDAASSDPATGATPAGTPTSLPAALPDPPAAPPVALPTCNLPAEGRGDGGGGGFGTGTEADLVVIVPTSTDPETIRASAEQAPWASSRGVSVGFVLDGEVYRILVTVPVNFTPNEFAVATAWFKAVPDVVSVTQGSLPTIAVMGCLDGVADVERLAEVLAELREAGQIGGYSYSSANDRVELFLGRPSTTGTDRDWQGLATTFEAFGTVSQWTVFANWPS